MFNSEWIVKQRGVDIYLVLVVKLGRFEPQMNAEKRGSRERKREIHLPKGVL